MMVAGQMTRGRDLTQHLPDDAAKRILRQNVVADVILAHKVPVFLFMPCGTQPGKGRASCVVSQSICIIDRRFQGAGQVRRVRVSVGQGEGEK